MESLNEEMSNQLWKMNIKHLCKVPYIKQESPRASRYYLSILYWFYMPVYSSKKKTKQPNTCYLSNVVMLSSDIRTKFSRQLVGWTSITVGTWYGQNISWQFSIYIFKLHPSELASWLSFQVLILDNYVHQLIEGFVINCRWQALIKKHILQTSVFDTKKLVCLCLRKENLSYLVYQTVDNRLRTLFKEVPCQS